ncbi:MAG: L,D-transpeptidase [Gammaproteobacteria bacterium TMED78]|nr:MAG: L,D-transpeptidase [Gammaproteobacteria bacterium TMED78]|tara:strand:- start:79222 stop:79707 length:486 start_codon:yes stop_codon:yes gene_type:complete
MLKKYININLKNQKLVLIDNKKILKSYLISSSIFGSGEKNNSFMTPRGQHIVRAKIGTNAPIGSVFVGRRLTGEIFNENLRLVNPRRDWILTRIIWLSGTEVGKNRLGDVDTMQRYIYIHGSPDKDRMGEVGSRGCIRMNNIDILELFDLVNFGMTVIIED